MLANISTANNGMRCQVVEFMAPKRRRSDAHMYVCHSICVDNIEITVQFYENHSNRINGKKSA